MSTWNTPITWVSGTVATAANLNTLRDNALWLRGAFTINGITSDTQRFIQAGTNNITTSGPTTTVAVTFPVAFATTPFVVVCGASTSGVLLTFRATSTTTTGFNLVAATGDGSSSSTTVAFNWIAVNVP